MVRARQYVELANVLATRWSALAPGTMVESEHHLAEEFGVNRLTAREAVRELERRMVVRRIMGRGTFTAHRLAYEVRLGGYASFKRNVTALGFVPSTCVVDHRWQGRGSTRQLVVERVSTVDGFVASATTERFPAAIARLVGDDVVGGGSIHEELVQAGFDPRRGSVDVAVAMPPDEKTERLGFSSAVLPTWHLESRTTDGPDGPIVHTSDSWMRTDMFAVTVRLSADDS
ncbi:GntR family transcriptional regulator [Ilumatobacter sp.]|uniref:GntR family transcriptional regulator n=1 Tax=Ilumatobacter sp. TaxID=1967498 RepID=UPI003C418B6F